MHPPQSTKCNIKQDNKHRVRLRKNVINIACAVTLSGTACELGCKIWWCVLHVCVILCFAYVTAELALCYAQLGPQYEKGVNTSTIPQCYCMKQQCQVLKMHPTFLYSLSQDVVCLSDPRSLHDSSGGVAG